MPAHVDGVVFARVQDGFGHGDACRQVVDAVHFLEQGPEFGAVIHVPAGEVDIRGKRLRVTGGQVVESAHLVTFTGELVGKGGTEETGCTGD